MRYFYEQIVQFAEDPRNQPTKRYYRLTTDRTTSNSIKRFIYSNQSVRIRLSRDLIDNNKQTILRVYEMDSDVKENNKFYQEGMAFCECDCSRGVITLVKELYDVIGDDMVIQCMVYGAELATKEFQEFISSIAIDSIDFSPHIPDFGIQIERNFKISEFSGNKYYPNLQFENKLYDICDTQKFIKQHIPVSVLFTNIPFEIYSECQNDIHQLNYNINHKQFVSLRKSIPRFQEICGDIQRNGIQCPLTFILKDSNIVPIENSSRILMAILLGLPAIPACIFATDLRYDYTGLYHDSKNTAEKLNRFLYPYFILNNEKV